ncbi:MAG: 50S ribosomal protein L17 [Verrucomicrobiota bacterium]
MKSQHRRAMLANMVCSLIQHSRIQTTIAKAKVARRFADKMITLAKKGTIHHRRQALAFLRQKDIVSKLFTDLGKQHSDRQGGYTRIIRVGQRVGDAAEIAILEWTGTVVTAPVVEKAGKGQETKPAGEKAAATEKKAAKKPAKKAVKKADSSAK